MDRKTYSYVTNKEWWVADANMNRWETLRNNQEYWGKDNKKQITRRAYPKNTKSIGQRKKILLDLGISGGTGIIFPQIG